MHETSISDVVFDLKLTPYEFTIYAVIKSASREMGFCAYSHQEIADKVGCSKAHVKTCLRKLQLPQEQLGGLALLEIQKGRVSPKGKNISNNIWPTIFVQLTDLKK